MIPSKMVGVNVSLVVVWTLLLATADCAEANDNASVSTEGIDVNSSPLPIENAFKLPSPLPSCPGSPGCEFGSGEMDIGGLHIRQVSSLEKIFATKGGGPDDLGATFYRHYSSIPIGFSMLGAYAQPNNQQLSGRVLVGKTDARDESGPILKPPTDYTLIASTRVTRKKSAYFWLPRALDDYAPVGLLVTSSPNKPSLDDIRCVRSDFTEEAETDQRIWGDGNGLNIYGLRPKIKGAKAQGLSVGTFTVQTNNQNTTIAIACLKNKNPTGSGNPTLDQVKAVFKKYSPYIYFHNDERYLPSSVKWFFTNGALLYKKGDESHPVRIRPDGSNLPQGGSNDGAYWLDLPADGQARENLKGGDKQLSGPVYLHVKPVPGSMNTDIQIWIFYPFNGHARLRIGKLFEKISLEPIGEHVSDWEHFTLRINNFKGALQKVYFAAHAGGAWVDVSQLEYQDGNKVVVYASLNGHASYSRAGLVLLGEKNGVGIRDETARGFRRIDTGATFEVVSADGLRDLVEPPWLNYMREWGPTKTYDFGREMEKIEKKLPAPVRKAFRKFLDTLPKEFLGQEGPTGPKMKSNWAFDEI